MAVNIFKFLGIKPFPFNEIIFKETLRSEINKQIKFVNEDATEGQKTSLCARAIVSDEDELIEYLEEVLETLNTSGFIKKQAEQYFNELYGNFLKQLPLIIDNGVIFEDELNELIKKFKLDINVAKEVINYKENELPKYTLKPKRPTVIKNEKKLISDADYKNIKTFFVGTTKPTYASLCEFFDVKDITSATNLKTLIDKKTRNIDTKLDASSDLVLYNILKKYCTEKDFKMLLESLYIKDIITLFEQIWIKNSSDGYMSWEELKDVYIKGVEKGYKPTEITESLTYWCEINEKFLYIPPEITDVRDDFYECPFCGTKYYKAVSSCPKCKYTTQDATYLVDRLLKFSQLDAKYRVLRSRLKELNSSFADVRKYASPEVKNIIRNNELFVKRKNTKRKVRRVLFVIFTILISLISGYIYHFSYNPYNRLKAVETYYISSQADFIECMQSPMLNDIYILTEDISFFGDEMDPIGSIDNPFTGHFYGNGHTLSNFSIKEKNGISALFMYNNGTIENLGLEDVTIESTYHSSGFIYQNDGVIKNCFVRRSIINSSGRFALTSGFAINNNGTIECCYSEVISISSSYFYAPFVIENSKDGIIKDTFALMATSETGFIEFKYYEYSLFYYKNEGILDNVYSNLNRISNVYNINDEHIQFIKYKEVNEEFYKNKLEWSSLIWDYSNNLADLKEVEDNE